jgi:hypothetical protein
LKRSSNDPCDAPASAAGHAGITEGAGKYSKILFVAALPSLAAKQMMHVASVAAIFPRGSRALENGLKNDETKSLLDIIAPRLFVFSDFD